MRSGFLNACPPSESSASSSSSAQDKGIRNKRKFRTDHDQQTSPPLPPLADGGCDAGDGSSGGGSECGSSWTMDPPSLNSGDATSGTTDSTSCFSMGTYNMPQNHMMHQVNVSCPGNMPSPSTHGIKTTGFCAGFQPCCKEGAEYEDLQEPDWDNYSESQLEEILLNMLDVLYKDAVERIMSLGFGEKDALDAVLKNGRWNGKDALTSVVESSLTWLRSCEARGGGMDFLDLKEMERHVLTEMVCSLRKVRPFLSKGDAMWCLLVCDMNSATEDDAVSPSIKGASSPTAPSLDLKNSNLPSLTNVPSNTVPLPQQAPRLFQASVQPSSGQACMQPSNGLVNPSRDNRSAFSTPSFSSSPVGKVAVANRQGNSDKSYTSKNVQPPATVLHNNTGNSNQEPQMQASNNPSLCQVVPARIPVSEQQTTKLGLYPAECASGGGQCSSPPVLVVDHLVSNVILSQEKQMLEALSSQCLPQSFQTSSQSAFSGQAVSLEASSQPDFTLGRLNCGDSCGSNVNDTNPVQTDLQIGTGRALTGFPRETWLGLDTVNGFRSSETELSLVTSPVTSTEVSSNLQLCKDASISSSVCHGGSVDKILGWTRVDGEQRKTEMLLQLVDRIKYLESQLQEWSEWAQQKVMQAARRLRKDSVELKALRLERDEYARLKKEKQTLEESTMKKLSEMENALRKALSQVERANTTARGLKQQNAEARAEMEAAKLTAAEYVSVCQEVAKRENKSVKKAQAWEKQKMKLQDELAEEKRKLASLLKQLSQAQEQHQQAEVRWRQEKKAKEDALVLAQLEKRAKEQVELSSKSREEALQRKSEIESQHHRDEVRKLQCEIARLKCSAGLQPAMTWFRPCPDSIEACSSEKLKQINARLLSEIAELQDSQRDVHRDHECVMCMSEEMSVVFLPCAHQVVCIKCNDLHQKQGLTDCPSCRTPIQQRIRVYGVNS